MIADLKPHAAYKDSGLDWLGSIPAHWTVWRVSRFAKVGNGSTPSRAQPRYWDRGIYPWLNSSQVNRGYIDHADQFITPTALRECHLPRVTAGSVLVAITGQGKTRGMSAKLGIEATINQHLAYITPRLPVVSTDYLHLALSAAYPQLRAISDDTGSTKGALTCEDLKRFKLALPPQDEQSAIVRFLAWTNGRLDRTIRAKRKVIALLLEQKLAIIHGVVTRGLDPNVPLKPSGLASRDTVPEHWEVRRLKSLVKESVAGPYGSSLTKSMYTSSGYRVYGQQQVIPDNFDVGDYYISKEQFLEMQRYRVYAGDVLVSVMGTVGKVAVVPEGVEEGIINPRLVRYRPDFAEVRPRWLQIAMQDSAAQAQLLESSKGTTMNGLNMQSLGKLLLLKPPLAEQDAILNYVSTASLPLVIAIGRIRREIELLREYRNRLVADVVTGALDIGGVVARLADGGASNRGGDPAHETDEAELTDEEAET